MPQVGWRLEWITHQRCVRYRWLYRSSPSPPTIRPAAALRELRACTAVGGPAASEAALLISYGTLPWTPMARLFKVRLRRLMFLLSRRTHPDASGAAVRLLRCLLPRPAR